MDSGELLYRFGWESMAIASCPHASRCRFGVTFVPVRVVLWIVPDVENKLRSTKTHERARKSPPCNQLASIGI